MRRMLLSFWPLIALAVAAYHDFAHPETFFLGVSAGVVAELLLLRRR